MNTTRLAKAPKSPLSRAIEAARQSPWMTEGITFFRRRRAEEPMTRAQLVKAITKRCHCGGTCDTCTYIIKDVIGEDYPH